MTETILPRTSYPHTTVTAELLAALVEAVVLASDPRARSTATWRPVQKLGDTVEWPLERNRRMGRAADQERATGADRV